MKRIKNKSIMFILRRELIASIMIFIFGHTYCFGITNTSGLEHEKIKQIESVLEIAIKLADEFFQTINNLIQSSYLTQNNKLYEDISINFKNEHENILIVNNYKQRSLIINRELSNNYSNSNLTYNAISGLISGSTTIFYKGLNFLCNFQKISFNAKYGLPTSGAIIINGVNICFDDVSNKNKNALIKNHVNKIKINLAGLIKKRIEFTILQTAELNNHVNGYGPYNDYTPFNIEDNDSILGGYSRIATIINNIRKQKKENDLPVLLFDSGAFLMGTMYDMVKYESSAIKFLKYMNYDAVNIGDREFDWNPNGLSNLLNNSIKSLGKLDVPFIASNIIFDKSSYNDDNLEMLFKSKNILHNKIINLSDGMKLGVIGIVGKGAKNKTPMAEPISFNHDYSYIQSLVDELKMNGANFIIVLNQSSIGSKGKGEDVDLAINVKGIDLIASGHTHTKTHKELKIDETIIISPGNYGKYLSCIDIKLEYNKHSKKIKNYNYKLIQINDTIVGDKKIQTEMDNYNNVIDSYLHPFNINSKTPISKINFLLEPIPYKENGLENLIADAIRTVATDKAISLHKYDNSKDPTSYSLSIVASGLVRGGLFPGKTGMISVMDVYNLLPLGITPDFKQQKIPGHPLISFYVTAPEIRNICEVAVSIAPLTSYRYYLSFSGIRFKYDETADLFNKVKSVYLCGSTKSINEGGKSDISSNSCNSELNFNDDKTLYRCVTNLYVLRVYKAITKMMFKFGFSIKPKDKDGNFIQIDNLNSLLELRIDNDPTTKKLDELKEWIAVVQFLQKYYPISGQGILYSIYGEGGSGLGRIKKNN